MIKRIVKSLAKQRREERKAELYRNLIRREAQIGGEIFGNPRPGGRREFFCLDERTWIWHEEWKDSKGQNQSMTTRYDVRTDGILKAQDGQPYQLISADEARTFRKAVLAYREKVNNELYSFVLNKS